QPEGPTSTTNSPSAIATSTPWMTLVAPKALRTPRIATEAIHSSRPAWRPNALLLLLSTLRGRKSSGFRLPKIKPDLWHGCPSNRHAAVDQMRLPGDVARFIGGQEHRQRRHFGGGAEPAHRLAADEILAHLLERLAGLLGHRLHALFERRRHDGARADGVAADAAADEIDRHRLGQPDHRRLGGAVDVAVGQ